MYENFVLYLSKNWFKKNRRDFNFSNVINKFYNKKKILDKIYLTNNIVESLYSKINYNLPKHKTTVYDFIKALENIILYDEIKISQINRNDHKTKTIILLIENENLNKHLHWINFDTFKKYYYDILLYKPVEINKENLLKKYNIELNLNNSESIYVFNKGIMNLGNICYINTILQVLYNIKEIKYFILTMKIQKENNNVLYALYNIFYNLNTSNNGKSFISPSYFIENYDNQIINIYDQQDAYEFLLDLIDKLEKWLIRYKFNNIFRYLFFSKCNNIYECKTNINHNFIKEEIYYTINLEIRDKKNIYESLDKYVEREITDKDNKIYCDKCKSKRIMYKTTKFLVLPRIFIFVLKRFAFNEEYLNTVKINDYYEFPEILDMSKYVLNKLENNKYQLFEVIIHSGLPNYGRYFCIVKNIENDYWIKYDDANVTIINDVDAKKYFYGSNNNVKEIDTATNAYILLYRKLDMSNCEVFDNIKIDTIINDEILNNELSFDIDDNISISEDENNEYEINTVEDKNIDYSENKILNFLDYFEQLSLNQSKKSFYNINNNEIGISDKDRIKNKKDYYNLL